MVTDEQIKKANDTAKIVTGGVARKGVISTSMAG